MAVHAGAEAAEDVVLGEGTTVWPLALIREGARLGAGCIVGRGAYVGSGVTMGDNCKLQNYALVDEPAVLEDGVFVGPADVFTTSYAAQRPLSGQRPCQTAPKSHRESELPSHPATPPRCPRW